MKWIFERLFQKHCFLKYISDNDLLSMTLHPLVRHIILESGVLTYFFNNSIDSSPLSSGCSERRSVWCWIEFYSSVGNSFPFGNVYLDPHRDFPLSLKLVKFQIFQYKFVSFRNFTYIQEISCDLLFKPFFSSGKFSSTFPFNGTF